MTDLYEELDFLDGIRDKVAILGNLMERFEASDILISDLKEINENLAELELMLKRKHISSDGKEAKFIFVDEFYKMEKTALKGRQDVWLRNLTSLKMCEFVIDTKSPETLLAYWKAQAEAGYPFAEENVRYFEDLVRKESEVL